MKAYKYKENLMMLDMLFENVLVVTYKYQIGYVGFNIGSFSAPYNNYSPYTYTTKENGVTSEGIYAPGNEWCENLETALQKICHHLIANDKLADCRGKQSKHDKMQQYSSSLAIVDFYRHLG